MGTHLVGVVPAVAVAVGLLLLVPSRFVRMLGIFFAMRVLLLAVRVLLLAVRVVMPVLFSMCVIMPVVLAMRVLLLAVRVLVLAVGMVVLALHHNNTQFAASHSAMCEIAAKV